MLEARHIQTYRELFVHREDLYARQTPSGSYFLNRKPVTDRVIAAHLAGQITAGWYPLTPDGSTCWVALDADRADGLETLQEAWQRLHHRGISSELELSRRGGHLWILFDPISAHVARRLVMNILPDLGGVEIFPKQDRLNDQQVGNPVRGPLGIHRRTGQRYPFVDPINLHPIAASATGTVDHLATTERLSAAKVAEQLAMLLDEATQPSERLDAPLLAAVVGASRSSIRQIKDQIGDPYAFISRFVALDEAGRGHCPFHPPDHNPSFAVDRRRGFWIDFHEINPRTGRYVGGDVVDFYRRFKNLSYRDAMAELKAFHGFGGGK